MNTTLILLALYSYLAHLNARYTSPIDIGEVRKDLDALLERADVAGSGRPEYPAARAAFLATVAERLPWYRPPTFVCRHGAFSASRALALMGRPGHRPRLSMLLWWLLPAAFCGALYWWCRASLDVLYHDLVG